MLPPRFVAWMFSMAIAVSGVGVAAAQSYPIKPVRIFVSQPGGGLDFAARIIGQGMQRAAVIARHNLGLSAPRLLAREIGGDGDERIQLQVECFDALEQRISVFDRGELARADETRGFGDRGKMQFVAHGTIGNSIRPRSRFAEPTRLE